MQKPISDKIQIGQTLNPAKELWRGIFYKRRGNTRKHHKQGR